ncbi:MAG: hypothetical protein EU549_03505 [Promethearchaeota archaeon]|nr:MAG: hypothetical protein EU549_03505 [Candidatus Lokiarchaeota archaeon]
MFLSFINVLVCPYFFRLVTTVCGMGRIEIVELIKNGTVLAVRVPGGDRIKFAYIDTELEEGEKAYYYIRITQFDGGRGWSSPIWIRHTI